MDQNKITREVILKSKRHHIKGKKWLFSKYIDQIKKDIALVFINKTNKPTGPLTNTTLLTFDIVVLSFHTLSTVKKQQ